MEQSQFIQHAIVRHVLKKKKKRDTNFLIEKVYGHNKILQHFSQQPCFGF